MIAPTQYRKPENWQDFEKLCKKLWGEVWKCSDTIQRNGRSGQNQKGVDIYGLPKDRDGYYGIQCKGKDDYTRNQLSKEEIESEISKAFHFEPKLQRLIFATTANKDVSIEEFVRKKNLEHRKKGLFDIYVSSWEDIVDLLEQYRDTYNWYINNCQYKEASDVEVTFDDKMISPKYEKTIINYVLKKPQDHEINNLFAKYGLENYNSFNALNDKLLKDLSESTNYNPFNWQKSKVNRTWCHLYINIKNSGSTTIEDFKLILTFSMNHIKEVSDCFYYCNDIGISETVRAEINRRKDENREVYEYSDCNNMLEYEPKNPILVQKDTRTFKIGIKPKQEINEISVHWKFLSRNFHKEGIMSLAVKPCFIEIAKTVEVDNISEVKNTEIIIKPLIEEI